MKINSKYFLFITIIANLTLLSSCADDNITVDYEGHNVFDFQKARVTLTSDIVTEGEINLTNYGFVSCDSIMVSFLGFRKNYSFLGFIRSDTSTSINITPKDSSTGSLLKLDVKQTGTILAGKLYYCFDGNNCNYFEIGHIIGQYTNHFEGFYYSPLFYGEFDVTPLINKPNVNFH